MGKRPQKVHHHHHQQQSLSQQQMLCSAANDGFIIMPKNYFDFSINEHREGITDFFFKCMTSEIRERILIVTFEDIIKRCKEAQKSNLCKCPTCLLRRRNFDDDIYAVLKNLHASLAKTFDANLFSAILDHNNDSVFEVSILEREYWDSFEEFWYESFIAIDCERFTLSEDITCRPNLFSAFIDFFPCQSILGDALRNTDGGFEDYAFPTRALYKNDLADLSPHSLPLSSKIDSLLFDDDQEYSDEDTDDCDDDSINGPSEYKKSPNSSKTDFQSGESFAEQIENNLTMISCCIGVIIYERILHEYRDKIASESRERLLKELELEQSKSSESSTILSKVAPDQTQKSASKSKKKKKNTARSNAVDFGSVKSASSTTSPAKKITLLNSQELTQNVSTEKINPKPLEVKVDNRSNLNLDVNNAHFNAEDVTLIIENGQKLKQLRTLQMDSKVQEDKSLVDNSPKDLGIRESIRGEEDPIVSSEKKTCTEIGYIGSKRVSPSGVSKFINIGVDFS